jgi:hypothetical protein
LRSLLFSISNHIAKSVNWMAVIKENMAARAFIGGICPVENHI